MRERERDRERVIIEGEDDIATHLAGSPSTK